MVNIDTFLKVLAYVYLYKANENYIDDIPLNELTATIVREGKPVKLFQQLEQMRFEITMPYEGIYYIKKDGFIPFQIIVSKEINWKNHVWLTALTKKLSVDHARLLIEASNDLTSQGEKELANSILQVSVDANGEQFLKLKGADGMEALRKIMQPEIEAAAREAAQEAARKAAYKGRLEGQKEGEMNAFIKMVKQGVIPIAFAAQQLGISESQFRSYLS